MNELKKNIASKFKAIKGLMDVLQAYVVTVTAGIDKTVVNFQFVERQTASETAVKT